MVVEAPEIARLCQDGQYCDRADAGKCLEALKVRVFGEDFPGTAIQVFALSVQFQVAVFWPAPSGQRTGVN